MKTHSTGTSPLPSHESFRRVSFPPERRLVVDTLHLGRRKPMMHGLLEIDVTRARRLLGEYRERTGESLSLESKERSTAHFLLKLPGPLRRLAFRAFLGSPLRTKRRVGTVLVTAVGMFGHGAGWGMSAPGVHNLSIVVGGIAAGPAAKSSEATSAEVLCLTLSANHELVDGAPFARFATKLAHELESATGLDILST